MQSFNTRFNFLDLVSFFRVLMLYTVQGACKLSEDFPNHIFTDTEQKYMMLLPFERGMFAVS
jgi:hypothetical protein